MKISGLHKVLFFLLITAAIYSGCRPEECVHKTGNKITKRVETGYFENINVKGMFDVVMVQDSVYYVEFSGGEDVLEYVQAAIADSSLWLDNSNRCLFLRDYEKIRVYIHFNEIKRLDLFESCKVSSLNPITSYLYMTVQTQVSEADMEFQSNSRFIFYTNRTTMGTYKFSGRVDYANLMGCYAAQIDASDLSVRELRVLNASVMDYYVNAEESLTVRIHNCGNIYYYGTPAIIIDSLTGSGQVIQMQ